MAGRRQSHIHCGARSEALARATGHRLSCINRYFFCVLAFEGSAVFFGAGPELM